MVAITFPMLFIINDGDVIRLLLIYGRATFLLATFVAVLRDSSAAARRFSAALESHQSTYWFFKQCLRSVQRGKGQSPHWPST